MAHTKAKGTTKLGRDSESKRLGVKIFGGSPIKCGQIIIRQRGTLYMPADGVKRGGDDTLYAIRDGIVTFKRVMYKGFNSNKKMKQFVSVIQNSKIKNQNDNAKSKKLKSGNQIKENLAAKEEIVLEKRKAEIKEAENTKTESEIIKQEQPIKMPQINKENKKEKTKN